MLNVSTIIRAQVDAGMRDIDQITSFVARAIIEAGDAETELVRLLRNRVVSEVRAHVSTTERRWAKSERAAQSTTSDLGTDDDTDDSGDIDWENTATSDRQALVREAFYAPGFGKVLWGQATVEQHAAARDHSLGIAASHSADASRHDLAIRMITEAGVTALDEIPGFADAARI